MELAQVRPREGVPGRTIVAAALAATLVVASLAGALAVTSQAKLTPGANQYNIPAWETRNLPNKWLFLLGEAIRGGPPSTAIQDANLARFLQLNAQIDDLNGRASDAAQRGSPDAALAAQLDALTEERDRIENQAEATLESRISQIAGEQGLNSSLFLFDATWPPVDAEFTEAPRMLATSPRDRIELRSTTLLREDLTLPQIESIESDTVEKDNVAALAFPIGGLGAYPTLVEYPEGYERAVDVVAHEWMHNHLFFRPLGFHYTANNDVRTINETVADLVGREIARLVVERWPISEAPGETHTTPAASGVDLGAALRMLRGEVDALLSEGKVEEAEALMEMRRQELAAQGHYIRKINQAYFAYLNLYAGEAGSPAAVNPIGPKVDELRRRTGSLERFVQVVGGITTVEQLDAALGQYR